MFASTGINLSVAVTIILFVVFVKYPLPSSSSWYVKPEKFLLFLYDKSPFITKFSPLVVEHG